MTKTLKNKDGLNDFSFVLGGPLYQFYLRAFLAKPPLNLCRRRIVAFATLTWLPLLLLSFIGGTAYSGVKVPFIYDLGTHARFLGALTLFIGAEPIVHELIRIIVAQFVDRNIITEEDRPAFNRIISSAMQLRNSVVIEIALILLSLTLGHWIWQEYITLDVNSWYASVSHNHTHLTLAGYWSTLISLPIFQFILLRWYYRLFIWYRFLWQVSRLSLRLNALHPDRAGGLGFLANSVFAIGPVLLAHTVLLSGLIGSRIWHTGVPLTSFKTEIAGIMIYLIILAVMPMTFFFSLLAQVKRSGQRDYGMVASHYVNTFRHKWMNNDLIKNESLLGTPDIQSLADLSTSFNVTQDMRLLPFGKTTILQLVILIAAPLFPLLLTMMPLEQMINSVIKVIL